MKILARTIIPLCAIFMLLFGTSFADTGSPVLATTTSTLPMTGTGTPPVSGKIFGTISWRYWSYPSISIPLGYLSPGIVPIGGASLVVGLWPDQPYKSGTTAISYQTLPVTSKQTSVDYRFAPLPQSPTGKYYVSAVLSNKAIGQFANGGLPLAYKGTLPADQIGFTYKTQRIASGINFQLKALLAPTSTKM